MREREREVGRKNDKNMKIRQIVQNKRSRGIDIERDKEGETAREKRHQAAAGNRNRNGKPVERKSVETGEDEHNLNQRG